MQHAEAGMTADVSVIIPTLGRRSLPTLLAELRDDPAVREVIVVDDRPEATPPLSPGGGPKVQIVPGLAQGPAPARQRGAETASGELLLVLDDDVSAPAGLAARHARRHRGRAGLVVVGAMPLVCDGSPSPAQELYRDDYARWQRHAANTPGHALGRLWGGNFSLHRSDALAVGLANPRFGGYRHEDLELGLRFADAGLIGIYDPSLSVEHRYVRTVARFLEDAWWQGAGWAALRQLHPDSGLPPPGERYTAGIPPALAACVGAAAGPRAIRLARPLLDGLRRAARAGGARATEIRVLQLRRRIEQLNGSRSRALLAPGNGGGVAPTRTGER